MRESVGRQRKKRWATASLFTVVMALVIFQAPGATEGQGIADPGSLTYTHGQPVIPVFFGWMRNPDGTADVWFSYLNRNWQEELDIPIGPNNNIQPAPYGPDGGQPTHFFPRVNRWQFAVRVPKDFGSKEKEIIWTLTSHGQTHRAYATLEPAQQIDEFLILYEYNNVDGPTASLVRGRVKPTLQVEGPKQRTVKVGQPSPLVAVATTQPIPEELAKSRPAAGLRLAWFVYRGAGNVTFDPPIPFTVWEDRRRNSPWARGFRPPPIPPGNKWIYNVTFHQPGTYVLRAHANDGYLFKNEDLTFTVTP